MPTIKIKKFKSKSSFKMKKKLSKSKSKSKNKNRKTKSLSRKRNYRRKNKLIGGSFAEVVSNTMAVELELGQGHCYPITDTRFKDYKTFTLKFSNMLFKNCSQEYKKILEELLRVDLNNIENKNKLSILLDIMTEEKDITEVDNRISKVKQKWQHITHKVIDELKEKLNFLNLLNYCLWLFDLLKKQNNTSNLLNITSIQIIHKINNTKRFVSSNLDRKINKTDINIKKIVDYQMTIYKICLILINIINSEKEINNTINDSKLMTPLNNHLELLKIQSISLESISFIDFTDKTGGAKYYKALKATVGGILFGVVATAACLTGILIFLFGLAFESDKIIGFAIRIFGWTAETSVAIFNVISDVFKTLPPNTPHLYLDPPPPPPNRTRQPMYLPPTPNMHPYPPF